MYLETDKETECKTSGSKHTTHSKPAIEMIDDDKIFDEMHVENSAPISRYIS